MAPLTDMLWVASFSFIARVGEVVGFSVPVMSVDQDVEITDMRRRLSSRITTAFVRSQNGILEAVPLPAHDCFRIQEPFNNNPANEPESLDLDCVLLDE